MAIMEIGSQVFVELGAGVGRILLPKRHSGVEAALDALEVELLHSEQSMAAETSAANLRFYYRVSC
jgi:hypothetical protein